MPRHDDPEGLAPRRGDWRTNLRDLVRTLPALAAFPGIAWWLTPHGAPASRFWWTLLAVFCVPLALWALAFAGYFWMWRRWAKSGK